jgi:hypothetical protein
VSARHVIALLPALAGGCILVVEGAPDGASTVCRIAGQNTACGQCVTNVCVRELNACCAEAYGLCDVALAKLEECTQNPGSKACDVGESTAFALEAGPLAKCVERSCAGACLAGGTGGAGGGGSGRGGAGGRAGAGGRGGGPPVGGVNTLRPCSGDDAECPPREACGHDDRCRLRCEIGGENECGDGECGGDVCGDPIGTPCDPDESFACGTGRCINVNDRNITVPSYCSIFCYATFGSTVDPCPAGYVCHKSDSECRTP